MRLLIINSVCGTGSTGRICIGIAKRFEADGYEVKIAHGRDREVLPEHEKYSVRIGGGFSVILHGVTSRLFDRHGLGSHHATKKFLKWADEYDPDELWLHNLHGYYINYPMLFEWIKSRPSMKVRWTLHDCWAFTGHCTHFTVAGCDRWRDGCHDCPQKGKYPASVFADNSKKNYILKKRSFTGVSGMTLVTPSEWLAVRLRNSFLSDYPIEVIPNEIDRTVFKPTPSDFRAEYGLEGKKIVLGVASVWTKDKGSDDFFALAKMLPEEYQPVMVGYVNPSCGTIPERILHIERTDDSASLAKIYTASDVYVCTSREETFGMTCAEALCCGTPAVVYKGTACEETAKAYGGTAVEQNVKSLASEILRITS